MLIAVWTTLCVSAPHLSVCVAVVAASSALKQKNAAATNTAGIQIQIQQMFLKKAS